MRHGDKVGNSGNYVKLRDNPIRVLREKREKEANGSLLITLNKMIKAGYPTTEIATKCLLKDIEKSLSIADRYKDSVLKDHFIRADKPTSAVIRIQDIISENCLLEIIAISWDH